MAGAPRVNQIVDAATRAALRQALEIIQAQAARIDALEATVLKTDSPVDARGERIINVGTPQAETDAVTVSYLRNYVQAAVGAFAIQQDGPVVVGAAAIWTGDRKLGD